MSTEELFKSLEEDLGFYSDAIKEVAFEVLDKEISEHPVFIAHKAEANIGQLILNREDYNTEWSVNASVLEELAERKLVLPDKLEAFKDVFKDPREQMCVLMVSEQASSFVFFPYRKEKEQPNFDINPN